MQFSFNLKFGTRATLHHSWITLRLENELQRKDSSIFNWRSIRKWAPTQHMIIVCFTNRLQNELHSNTSSFVCSRAKLNHLSISIQFDHLLQRSNWSCVNSSVIMAWAPEQHFIMFQLRFDKNKCSRESFHQCSIKSHLEEELQRITWSLFT